MWKELALTLGRLARKSLEILLEMNSRDMCSRSLVETTNKDFP